MAGPGNDEWLGLEVARCWLRARGDIKVQRASLSSGVKKREDGLTDCIRLEDSPLGRRLGVEKLSTALLR
jgi:hypothetical protein